MAVTITVGEKFWNTEFVPPGWDVERDNHPDAPVFPNDETLEPASNWRYVNIPVWSALAVECGIEAWLTDPKTGLLASAQAGQVRPLTAEDYRVVNEAYLLRSAFREGQPGWDAVIADEEREQIGELIEKSTHDEYLARLTWLRFWIRWALDHCEHPAVVVSW